MLGRSGEGLPRLVATDLDGTLLHTDGTVTERTRRVLAELDERGVPVVFVTGRPMRWMEALWPEVGGHGLAIVSNGAILYDVAVRRVRDATGIDAAAGRELCDAISAAVPGASYAIECQSGIRRDRAFAALGDPPTAASFSRAQLPVGSPVGPIADLWDEPAVKLLVRHPDLEPAALQERVSAAVGGCAVVTWSMPGLVEISAPGITKAARLVEVADELDVPAADVVAFGDMPNDLPMLEWAGHSYAMANAHPTVRAVADHVAPAHDEDGVAVVLSEIFGLTP